VLFPDYKYLNIYHIYYDFVVDIDCVSSSYIFASVTFRPVTSLAHGAMEVKQTFALVYIEPKDIT
jgi:hypothetical protein